MKTYHALLVEDSIDTRRMLRAGVESLGQAYHVVDVPSGEEALLVSSQQRIDLLVSDFRLAGISGLDLYRKIKQRHPAVKTILITGISDARIREEITQSGADYYFFKPISIADFLQAIELLLPPPKETGSLAVKKTGELTGSRPRAVPNSLAEALATGRKETGSGSLAIVDPLRGVIAEDGAPIPAEYIQIVGEYLKSIHERMVQLAKTLNVDSAESNVRFRTKDSDLYLAPLGVSSVLFLSIPLKGTESLYTLSPSTLIASVKRIQPFISEHEARISPEIQAEIVPQPQEPAASQAGDTDSLENLFNQADQLKGERGSATDFWDALAEQSGQEINTGRERLSFDQALQRGIAPEEPD